MAKLRAMQGKRRKKNPLTRSEAGRQLKFAKRELQDANLHKGTDAEIWLRGNAHGRARVVDREGPRVAGRTARKIQFRSETFRGRRKNPAPLLILGNPKGKRRKFRRASPSFGECPKGFPAKIWRNPQFQAERRVFIKRHGANVPIKVTRVKMPPGSPQFMTAFGVAQHAVYDAPKQRIGGNRYKHHFGRKGKNKPWLVSSASKGQKWLGYAGGTFKAKTKWLFD